jgi:KDO2-lipid IV(A) lauroyltransferase
LTDDPARRPARRRKKQSSGLARTKPFLARLSRNNFLQRASAGIVRAAMAAFARLGRERALRFTLRLFRLFAPLLPETHMARASIAAAFPEKSAAEREAILRGAWDNFARVVVEFVFLEDLAAGFDPANPAKGAITISGVEHFVALRDDGKPAVIVAAHLANWEVLGVVAHKYGLPSVLPFRGPANLHFAGDVLARRQALMGTLVDSHRGATFQIAAALDRGDHLGMLVDQRLNNGIDVPFFGRRALTNPMPAKLARQYDCPVHGARAIRRPDGGLHLELTGPLDLPRDSEGLIEVAGATIAINALVEKWVREHPEQWFWLHDRWRHPKSGR